MYKIESMDINSYSEIINLWKNTAGVGLSGKDDSKKSIEKFWENNGYKIRKDLNSRAKIIMA